jgi:hypothetical protein
MYALFNDLIVAPKFIDAAKKYRLVDELIMLMRSLTAAPSAITTRHETIVCSKNLAIACAKLCRTDSVLMDRVRELQGLGLMYSMGDKILKV